MSTTDAAQPALLALPFVRYVVGRGLVWPLPLAVLAAHPELRWLLTAMLVGGASLDLAVVFYETARQQQVPEELVGRVSSLSTFGETALVPLAYVLAGTVADRIGSTPVMWICCGGILAVTVALLPVREVRRSRGLPAGGRDAEGGGPRAARERDTGLRPRRTRSGGHPVPPALRDAIRTATPSRIRASPKANS
ncbi:hypothetical protein [Streptomyces sp. NPDC096153]|uniref:hypothetical protein n=1 Tax=Streptomyces sp. NPDC096153 TaxID=3155548 RepID=UPI0033277680